MQKYLQCTSPFIADDTKLVINDFLLSLQTRNLAEATTTKYCRVLTQFFRECKVDMDVLTSDDVSRWLIAFSEDKKPRTIDLYLSVLSAFSKFCMGEGYIKKVLVKKRWRPKITKSLPRHLTEQEYAQVKLVSEKLSNRNRALIIFLLDTGCRKKEVIDMKIKDVDMKKRTALVKGKGSKYRNVHFSTECAIILQTYLLQRSGDEEEPLFLSKFGSGLKRGGMDYVVKNVGELAGLQKQLSPHWFRHTFGTNMLKRGADIEFIARELGHANLNTTCIYARILTEELKNDYHNKKD